MPIIAIQEYTYYCNTIWQYRLIAIAIQAYTYYCNTDIYLK